MGQEGVTPIGRGRSRYLTFFLGAFAAFTIVLLIVGVASLSLPLSVISVFFAVTCLGLFRAAGRSACFSADQLRIRNLLGSYNLARSDIADFVINEMNVGGGAGRYEMIYVRKADGRMIGIEASARSSALRSSARQELAEEQSKLRSWLSGSPSV